ncbi:type IV inositol polyphosphate 5-phosphatase 3 isoform X3 [Tanacetum coccineum]
MDCSCLELFWRNSVINKWLNVATESTDFSPDADDSIYKPLRADICDFVLQKVCDIARMNLDLRIRKENLEMILMELFPGYEDRCQRRPEHSISTQKNSVSVNTWNLGGEVPPEDLDISEWLDTDHPADVYVIGFQEIIPLNAGYIIGSEDTRPIPIWENIVRKNLNKIQPINTKFKGFSDPPSPSRFKPSKDTPNIEDEVVLESDTDSEQQFCTFNDSSRI